MSHIKHLLTDRDDPEEVRLYTELRDKYYQFLRYKMDKIRPDVPDDVKYDDTYRYRYSDIVDDAQCTPKPNTTMKHRKLALKFHPDKCDEPDASHLFNTVWNADDELIQRLTSAENPIEIVREFLSEAKENIDDELDQWLRSYPYNYHYFPQMFIPEDEYRKKREEAERYRLLQEEKAELRRAQKELREMEELLRADKLRASDARFEALFRNI